MPDRLLARYSGVAWVRSEGAVTPVAALSEDDPARHARGFRNRWRYTLTGAPVAPLPSGCELRRVRVRVLPGGLVDVSIDAVLELLILPGDPAVQDAIGRNAGACEVNSQLVNVREVSGRWQVLIEEPETMPDTWESCGRPSTSRRNP